jgi:acyl-CoA thioester hydrolase
LSLPRRCGSGCSCTDVAGLPLYQTAILPEWIDYNGHLRDAYYGLILSLAIDALMERIGVDAAYRQRTGCTLYTLETHLHYLHEVKQDDTVMVTLRIAGADAKRIHAALELLRAGHNGVAASAEAMLLHVCQQSESVHSTHFPPPIAAAIAQLQAASAGLQPEAPGSRRLQLPAPARPP